MRLSDIGRKELTVVALIIIVWLVATAPSIVYARRERRDGVRRDEAAALKRQLEAFYNEHERYPLTFTTGRHTYTVVASDGEAATGWYLRTELENTGTPGSSFDHDEGRSYFYRIVRDGRSTFYDVCGGEASCGPTEMVDS